jgi:hypothetical protein
MGSNAALFSRMESLTSFLQGTQHAVNAGIVIILSPEQSTALALDLLSFEWIYPAMWETNP